MRNALAKTLYELAKEDDRIITLVADISPAGAMEDFRREFPSRFLNVGVAEQSMIGLAAGLAQRGFKPFCYTIATFALFRAYEFVRCDLAYQNLNVTLIGMGAGLSYSTLGGTHQAVEDVAVAMAMPNLTVLAPCDPAETAECARWCASRESGGPVYLRLGKVGEPGLTGRAEPWQFGEARLLQKIEDANEIVLSYGPVVDVALSVAHARFADMAAVATLSDLKRTIELVNNYDEVVVIEEASGAPLASALGSVVSANTRGGDWGYAFHSFALPREFGHIHGTRAQLLDHYGLTAEKIIAQLR